MKIREIMTRGTHSVSPDTPVIEAAAMMRLHDIGVVPVISEGRIVGMLTDRDIVVQVVADGDDPKTTPVSEAMSTGSISVSEDHDVSHAADLMRTFRVRRLPVLDSHSNLVGMVTLGDLAVDANASLTGNVLKEVSDPAQPLP